METQRESLSNHIILTCRWPFNIQKSNYVDGFTNTDILIKSMALQKKQLPLMGSQSENSFCVDVLLKHPNSTISIALQYAEIILGRWPPEHVKTPMSMVSQYTEILLCRWLPIH